MVWLLGHYAAVQPNNSHGCHMAHTVCHSDPDFPQHWLMELSIKLCLWISLAWLGSIPFQSSQFRKWLTELKLNLTPTQAVQINKGMSYIIYFANRQTSVYCCVTYVLLIFIKISGQKRWLGMIMTPCRERCTREMQRCSFRCRLIFCTLGISIHLEHPVLPRFPKALPLSYSPIHTVCVCDPVCMWVFESLPLCVGLWFQIKSNCICHMLCKQQLPTNSERLTYGSCSNKKELKINVFFK